MANNNEALFDSLVPKPPAWAKAAEKFLEEIWTETNKSDPDLTAVFIFSDWLEEVACEVSLASEVRKCVSRKALRQGYATAVREWYKYGHTDVPRGSNRLAVLRKRAAYNVLRLLPWFLNIKALDSVNAFTRNKMREDGFLRRILPPTPLVSYDFEGMTLENDATVIFSHNVPMP